MAGIENEITGRRRRGGIISHVAVDVIKWEPATSEESALIVHKFEKEDFPNGSQLIVAPSQIAVFINNLAEERARESSGANPTAVSVFLGPCRIKLETGETRIAPFRNLAREFTGGESAYHSSVYFINTTYMNELNWGTQAPILVVDPEEEVNVHVRAFGLFGVHIEHLDASAASIQAEKFLRRVVGTRADYTRNELVQFMRAKILERVPDLLANKMVNDRIGILSISTHLSEFSAQVHQELTGTFDDFGLTLDNFSFHSINVPEEDLAEINALKVQRKKAQLEAQGNAMKMDIESEARARMRQREGYTYQQEQTFNVMQAAASNEGMASTFTGAGMGLGVGMGMGRIFGNGLNQMADNVMNSAPAAPAPSAAGTVCPACHTPLPEGAKFCFNCGASIDSGRVCPVCGNKLMPGAKFCMNCGAKLEKVCPQCGKPVQEGTKFCMNCGFKLEA